MILLLLCFLEILIIAGFSIDIHINRNNFLNKKFKSRSFWWTLFITLLSLILTIAYLINGSLIGLMWFVSTCIWSFNLNMSYKNKEDKI